MCHKNIKKHQSLFTCKDNKFRQCSKKQFIYIFAPPLDSILMSLFLLLFLLLRFFSLKCYFVLKYKNKIEQIRIILRKFSRCFVLFSILLLFFFLFIAISIKKLKKARSGGGLTNREGIEVIVWNDSRNFQMLQPILNPLQFPNSPLKKPLKLHFFSPDPVINIALMKTLFYKLCHAKKSFQFD